MLYPLSYERRWNQSSLGGRGGTLRARKASSTPSLSAVGSPFGFWSAGTDEGIPSETRRWPRRSFWLTVAAFVAVIVLVAIFVNPN